MQEARRYQKYFKKFQFKNLL